MTHGVNCGCDRLLPPPTACAAVRAIWLELAGTRCERAQARANKTTLWPFPRPVKPLK